MSVDQSDSDAGSAESEPPKGWWSKTISGLVLLGALRKMSKLDEERDIPGVTRYSARAARLSQLATQLVHSGASDNEVIAALEAESKGRTRHLHIASSMIRAEGLWVEVEESNRIVRLLEAVANCEPVAPPRPEHQVRFADIGRFQSLNPDVAYEELKSKVPALQELEDSIVEATLRDRAAGEDEQSQGLAKYRHALRVLRTMVGPESGSSDVIVASTVANGLATWQLLQQTPDTSS